MLSQSLRERFSARTFAVALLVVSVLGGCANRGGLPGSSPAAALLAKSHSSAKTFESRLGLAVAAADLSARDIARSGGEKNRAIYNAACITVADLTQKVTLPVTLQTPVGAYRLAYDPSRSPGRWDPGWFTELIPTQSLKNKALVSRKQPTGFGGVLVGVRRPSDPRAFLFPRAGVSAPVTAVLNSALRTQPGEPRRVTLSLYDSSKVEVARIAGEPRSLAADLSAPFAYYSAPPRMGVLGMLRPGQFFEKEGIFLTQPYDPKKIPLVFIHGLMSDPFMWLPVMASIESDPILRKRYQFWVYAYPTGNPIAYSALLLRESLARLYEVYPRTGNMVIVNHSLGGVITHLQVIDSGEVLVEAIFKKQAPEILALSNDSMVRRGLVFRANARIDRVVFVAAPHRGAPLASNSIGSFGANLIQIPRQVVSGIGLTAIKAAASAAGIKGAYTPNSIRGLSPKSPLLVAMNTVPMKVPFHSIIGVAGEPKSPVEKTSDTVVPYWSSHKDTALSEKIVPYPHTAMFRKPAATDEIKRILGLHPTKGGGVP